MELQKYEPSTGIQRLQDFDSIVQRIAMVQKVYKDLMQPDQHYGVIPGTSGKSTLLKPGAEKLALAFNLASEYQIERRQLDGLHVEYQILCRIIDRGTGQVVGEGIGICSTMESKYRYRNQDTGLPIPEDYKQNKGAYKAKGFTAKKYDNNWLWMEKVDNPDIADQYNTVIKMAKKRAFVDAIITCTAASDIFTQDVEDMEIDISPTPERETQPRSKPEGNGNKQSIAETKDWNEEILKIEAYLAEHEENPEELFKALDGLSARIKGDYYPAAVAKRVQKIVEEWSKVLTGEVEV